MFGILVHARLRMLVNSALSAPPAQKGVVAVLVLFAALLFVGIGVGCGIIVRISQDTTGPGASGPLTTSAAALVAKIYEYLFFFLLAGSVPFVAATLFQAEDLHLLFTTPVSPRAVVAAKLVDATAVNAAQFMVLGVPVLAGLGWAVGLGPIGWFWLFVSTLFLLILPPTATAVTLLIAAKVLGMRQVRTVVMLVSIGLGLGITLMAIVGTNKLTSSGRINYHAVTMQLQRNQTLTQTKENAVVLVDNTPHWLPSSWAFQMLQSTAGGEGLGNEGFEGLIRLILSVGILVPLCLILGQNVFSSDAFLETSDSSIVRASSRQTRHPLLLFLTVQMAGMIIKDIKYISRDFILLGQIGTALILFIVPFLIRATSGSNDPSTSDLYGYLALAMLLLIAYMVTSVVSLTSIGLEGKSGWIVLGAPLTRGDLLRSKWALSYWMSLVVLSVLTLIGWAAFRWSWQETVLALLAWSAICYALSGLGVGLAGLFPRFIYENPAHRASVWALILGFFLATSYIVTSIVIVALASLSVLHGQVSIRIAVAIAVFCYVALTAVTGLVPVTLAERRLEQYEWQP